MTSEEVRAYLTERPIRMKVWAVIALILIPFMWIFGSIWETRGTAWKMTRRIWYVLWHGPLPYENWPDPEPLDYPELPSYDVISWRPLEEPTAQRDLW